MDYDKIKAVDLAVNSAPGPGGILTIFFIKTKPSVVKPVMITWWVQSLDDGKIYILKLAYITPLHNRGCKLIPKQYRLVSLT